MSLVVELPRAVAADADASSLLSTLSFAPRTDGSGIVARVVDADALGIAIAAGRNVLSVPLLPVHAAAGVEISPGQYVQAPVDARLERFLGANGAVLDHVGINFSQRDLPESAWKAFVLALASEVPAWRLDIGSVNDIVFVVLESADATPAAVLELVYDRGLPCTTLHFCVRVAADRATVEREFVAPFGGSKPGDEAFFRSVALPSLLRVPAYVDLAFSDAPIAPWSQTVQAIGRRIVSE